MILAVDVKPPTVCLAIYLKAKTYFVSDNELFKTCNLMHIFRFRQIYFNYHLRLL